jgi:hypothetical protein
MAFIKIIETTFRSPYYKLITNHGSLRVDTWINHLKKDKVSSCQIINMLIFDQAANRTG